LLKDTPLCFCKLTTNSADTRPENQWWRDTAECRVVGLECLVGASFAATALLQLPATFALLPSHRRQLWTAGDSHCAIAGLRKILGCVRRRDSFEIANSHSAKLAAPAGLRAPTAIQLPDSDHFGAAFASANNC